MIDLDHEIRRLPNGSLDIELYMRHCHRERSLATHRRIGQTAQAAGRAMRKAGNIVGGLVAAGLALNVASRAFRAHRPAKLGL